MWGAMLTRCADLSEDDICDDGQFAPAEHYYASPLKASVENALSKWFYNY